MLPPEMDSLLGLERYGTGAMGIGGRIRHRFEDFVVEEILEDGTRATVKETPFPEKLDRQGGFLLCVLQKRGVDTLSAMRMIAKRLGIPMGRLGFAGLKDANAWTGQVISLQRMEVQDLKGVSFKNFEVRPIRFSNMPVIPSLLLGNSFEVTVRDIALSEDEAAGRILEAEREITSLGGFPNYFGYQRFGSSRPITHLVGRCIIKGDLEGATMTFLSGAGEMESLASARARSRLRETGDFEEAWRLFPRHLWIERDVIDHLRRYPRDFANALRRMPLRLLRLTVQAYQSYLFNRILSGRISGGLSPTKTEPRDEVVEADYWTDHRAIGVGQMRTGLREKLRRRRPKMVIPLIGYDSSLSDGIQGELEREILSEEGVRPEDFKVKGIPEVSVRGSFRLMLASPGGLEFNVGEDEVNAGRLQATVRFRLQRGCYATVMMREVMKPSDPRAAGF